MKTYSLVYTLLAAAVLSACGSNTNQNPLSKYPKSQTLGPQDPTIQVKERDVEYRTKIETRIDKVVEYKVVTVPDTFFSILAPTQFQFVVGKPATFPIRVRGMVGQLKYELAVESSSLNRLKLENIKVEGNDTTADLTFTATSSDVQFGEIRFKMTLLEVKDERPEVEATLREHAKTKGVQVIERGYAVVPTTSAAAAVTVPAEVKGE